MRVLFVCSGSFRTGQTGDATQGRETINALRANGHDVVVAFVSYCPLAFTSEAGESLDLDAMIRIVKAADVVHLLPVNPTLCSYFRNLPHKPTLGSSIFWGGLERVSIAWKMAPTVKAKVHDALREMKPMVGFRMDYRGVDVFLPNSRAEGECVMRYFKTSPNAYYMPVPNGFVVPARERIDSLGRSNRVPPEDYIVVPGVFARRKNQLSLIRALKDSPYHVVFVGDDLRSAPGFMARCKIEANERMSFLGFIPNSSDEYWAILKYARCACLASDCETPGIAMIEAAYAGARPVITRYGGTAEYYGFDAEYLDPNDIASIRSAVDRAWLRGRLLRNEAEAYSRYSWKYCANLTIQAYNMALKKVGKGL